MAKTTVTPKIKEPANHLKRYDDLEQGECFLFNGCLGMKTDGDDQGVVDLATGKYEVDGCENGNNFLPVDVKITWSKPKAPKKSKK